MSTSMAIATIGAAAFQAMELAPFSSFADDTPQAQDAASQYPVARRMCLEACDWSFASTVVNLPQVAVSGQLVDPSLVHAFALPGDCVIFRHPLDLDTGWRLDGRTLRTDRPGPLAVRYTRDVDNENLMPASFQTALALRLAAMLSPRWVGSDSKTQSLDARAEMALKTAMRIDARSASLERYDGEDYGVTDWVGWATR
ncbi:hypothetical protein PARHAE_01083 [Paracoccus haematequi]|uniref:Uncharacterized protein n=1 Tax=Paracoccus haematequi TaxID=2491866 RepID=A0A3S4CHG4_9RHOB|nr:hypothetical protein [Paracoccus haematequi]VDS07903.1 hypothetical protein PARHAE_01083 [Paracoccus haematequi]